MILTLDIGNTNIKTALFDGKEMRYYWRMSTNIQKSSDEYGIVLVNLFQHVGVRPEEVEGIMISSVVPTINFTIEHMCQNYFGKTPLQLTDAEAVMLAGLPNAPSVYAANGELARRRALVVVERMERAKKLTHTQALELKDEVSALPLW